MRAIRVAAIAILCVAVLALAGCKKKRKRYGPDTPETNAAGSKPQPAVFPRAKAVETLEKYLWKGIVAGQPANLVCVRRGRRLLGSLQIGSKRRARTQVLSIRVRRNGRVYMRSRGKPTARGMLTYTYGGTISGDLKTISGSASRAVKRGFIEQSGGIGKFNLVRDKLKSAALAAERKAAGKGGAAGKAGGMGGATAGPGPSGAATRGGGARGDVRRRGTKGGARSPGLPPPPPPRDTGGKDVRKRGRGGLPPPPPPLPKDRGGLPPPPPPPG